MEYVGAVNTKIKTDHRIKISELCIEFLNVSHSTLFEIVKECLRYKKVCTRRSLKMLMSDSHQKERYLYPVPYTLPQKGRRFPLLNCNM